MRDCKSVHIHQLSPLESQHIKSYERNTGSLTTLGLSLSTTWSKVTGPTYWGSGYFPRNFWCVAIQEVKPGENESPCNGASTGFCFRTLPAKWRGAINKTSLFSLGKKIPETQRFNNHKILKKTAQNSICMRTATSYGHNTAKKNRGSSMTFPEIYSFFPFLEKTSIWTSMSLI